ncbi:MAG: molybdopterin cofactor-binding domain-containing protein [Ilumatobacteraceae bacterium]
MPAPASASTPCTPAYDEARAAGKPVGVGLGLKNSGLGNGFKEIARAVVRFRSDGKVEVRHCWTEMGQGVHTVAVQVAVEELGIARRRHRRDRRHDSRARGRADDRQPWHADGCRIGRRRLPCRQRGDGARSMSTTRAPTSSTGRTR